jgi:hypothetical protein
MRLFQIITVSERCGEDHNDNRSGPMSIAILA